MTIIIRRRILKLAQWPHANHSFISRVIICFVILFCFSEDEFREIFTFLKSDPKKADMLHKIMVKELHSAMTKDFEEILNEGDLKDALTKINRLSEESVISSKKDAWSVLYLLENRSASICFLIYFACFILSQAAIGRCNFPHEITRCQHDEESDRGIAEGSERNGEKKRVSKAEGRRR